MILETGVSFLVGVVVSGFLGVSVLVSVCCGYFIAYYSRIIINHTDNIITITDSPAISHKAAALNTGFDPRQKGRAFLFLSPSARSPTET